MKKHPILRRFMKRKASVLGAVILLLFFFTALLGPCLLYTSVSSSPIASIWS